MRSCEEAHREYERHACGKVQIGSLPTWMHVNDQVAWYVFKGPYSSLPEAWNEFMKKARSLSTAKLSGPPGDVYLCDPIEHKGDEKSMITILWAPVKR
jgi:hypothetical protein